MPKQDSVFRGAALLLLTCFLQLTLAPPLALGQAIDCPYERSNPTLGNARISFKSLNYKCAEQEILDFLEVGSPEIEEKADAHVLLAAVYFAMLKNDKEKRGRVIDQFKEAFTAYRDWRGELDISSTEFFDMMKEAQAQVDEEAAEPVPPPEEEEEEPVEAVIAPVEEAPPTIEGGKPWYKKWWAIGLGVGLVAGAVVLVAGGGGDGDGEAADETLPGFPDTPAASEE